MLLCLLKFSLFGPFIKLNSDIRMLTCASPLLLPFMQYLGVGGGWGWTCKHWSKGPADFHHGRLLIRQEPEQILSCLCPSTSLPASVSRSLWYRRHKCANSPQKLSSILFFLFYYFFLNDLLRYESPDRDQATWTLRVLSPRVDPILHFLFSSLLGKAEGDCGGV